MNEELMLTKVYMSALTRNEELLLTIKEKRRELADLEEQQAAEQKAVDELTEAMGIARSFYIPEEE